MGRKIKIGVLVFTKQIKERRLKSKDFYFDGKAYFGLNYILSEIDKTLYDVSYISSLESELNDVDFVLVSITSYYDILNLINELRGKNYKSKVIVGGAGLLNFSLLSKYIDIAVIGRSECIINEVLQGKEFENAWRKEKDKCIEKKYKVGAAKILIDMENYKEASVGCNKRCYFCQYGWKNELHSKSDNYTSGYNDFEDTIKNIDWNIRGNANYIVSAIDGMSENTRKIVNKQISNYDIENKINSFYESNRDYNAIKLYCIIGFPWEESIKSDFLETIKKTDRKSQKKLNIFIISTHFCPMPITPMENESVNFYNFRNDLLKNKYNYKGETVNVYWPGSQCSSPVSSIEECVVYRGDNTDLELIEKVFLSKKYKGLKSYQKIKTIKEIFPEKLWGKREGKVLDYIEYPKGFDAAQQRYYRLKEELLAA